MIILLNSKRSPGILRGPSYPVESRTVPYLIALCVLAFAGFGRAQNGLRDIPSTKVEDQIAGFQLPPGAQINLFAAEPLIKKPVHMNWDSSGRLWVVSSPLYPHIEPGQEEIDQVIVLEDSNGDGKADRSTVFADQLHIPTAVLPGDGGAYVANSTEMLFLQDSDGDGKADRRRIVLSGFGTEDTHHLIHTFRWGPEGMIWMNQSIYIHTHLETPYGIRRLLGGGMWHFRPETQRAEVFMKGLVNPWGHVFDNWGQSFMTDGAGGEGINFVFPRSVFMTSPGAVRILHGLNPGQPKHCGLEVLSGNHIPPDYRGTFAAPDFRGHRVNRFKLAENGTGAYQSTQVEDLATCTHRAFRPIDVKMGPDGAIYIADWYNPIIQHGEVDFRDERRDHEHGRIWRISFPKRKLDQAINFGKTSEKDLAAIAGPVGWNHQMATLELRQRDPEKALAGIKEAWQQERQAKAKTRVKEAHLIMATQAINRFQIDWAADLAENAVEPEARAAALRALYYEADSTAEAKSIAAKAVKDPHPRVRLWAVSVLSQLDGSDIVQLALDALDGIDSPDPFLDFAVWNMCREHAEKWTSTARIGNPFRSASQLLYAARALNSPAGAESIFASFVLGELSGDNEVAQLADWAARTADPVYLDTLWLRALDSATPDSQKISILEGLVNAGKLRNTAPSTRRDAVIRFLESKNATLFGLAARLAGQWKVASARPILESTFLADRSPRGNAALEGLRSFGGGESAAFLRNLAGDGETPVAQRTRAVIALSKFNPAEAARLAVALAGALEKKPKAAETIFAAFLANNNATNHLAKALNGKNVRLPEPVALAGMQKASAAATRPEHLIRAIQKAGGLQPMKMSLTPAEMNAMMQAVAEKGDPQRGETIYRRANLQCILCHAIGGNGGVVGPDLVSIGSSAPVDYLIESLIEPSKKIKEGYHTTLVTLKNGDTFGGAVASESGAELVIRDAAANENRIAKDKIANQTVSPVSLMPPGLTLQLREDEFIDLTRFLSELGKEGAFKTSAVPYLRKWEVLQPHERTRDAIGHYGTKIFAEEFPTYQWTSFYAKVDGHLPLAEMPDVKGRGRNRYGVARHHFRAAEASQWKLRIEGKSKDLSLFLDEREVVIPKDKQKTEIVIPVSAGDHRLTIVGLKGWGLEAVRVEVLSP